MFFDFCASIEEGEIVRCFLVWVNDDGVGGLLSKIFLMASRLPLSFRNAIKLVMEALVHFHSTLCKSQANQFGKI